MPRVLSVLNLFRHLCWFWGFLFSWEIFGFQSVLLEVCSEVEWQKIYCDRFGWKYVEEEVVEVEAAAEEVEKNKKVEKYTFVVQWFVWLIDSCCYSFFYLFNVKVEITRVKHMDNVRWMAIRWETVPFRMERKRMEINKKIRNKQTMSSVISIVNY